MAPKVGAYLDIAAIDKAGPALLKSLLAGLDAIKTPRQLAQWQGRMLGRLDTPVPLGADADMQALVKNLLAATASRSAACPG